MSPSPVSFAEKPPVPPATNATPTSDSAAAAQKLRCSFSKPIATEIRPIQTGLVPRINAAVAAVESLMPYTKPSWLT